MGGAMIALRVCRHPADERALVWVVSFTLLN
jgi:hypothetical protein